MLLFPFINSEGDDLVECVVLPEIPIWVSKKAEEGALLNRQLLVVILLFCAGRDEGEKINVDYYQYPSGDVDLGAGTKKSVIKARIQSVEENLMDLPVVLEMWKWFTCYWIMELTQTSHIL